ncbi:cobalamin B12-binding domain-containing protein [Acetivibrio clariflavus]|uniref:Putative cobalamin binding protein n=1 Tax=Acetivibrio clariflavus (strain DSM 19732 / NBRC 101661 / EBR45) TaxID=720554 RepID=G8LVC6_ACECE|nr:corrinoid protein [Acetivibrio clariflavus]AEV67480.1 putative cobalamin binding protein [Acetivibrio clariflavus DSM 19732]
MSILNEISENLQMGKAKVVKELVNQAIAEGYSAEAILKDGLLLGMGIIGEKFKKDEVYVPDVLIAARAMNAGTEILKPLLASSGVKAAGKVVLGTVAGDLHDIGKNLVRMMMEGKGLEVIDLGVDVPAQKFIDVAVQENAQIIACSALLTTTMGEIENVVKAAVDSGVRDKVTIMIGGAPVTQSFCEKVGADIYTPDAASAADAAAKVCASK